MDNRDSRINQILSYLASAAVLAADGVTDAVQNAGSAVEGKYNNVKLNIDLNRLQEEQRLVFTDIGRTHFLIKTGAVENAGSPLNEAQEIIDKLELKAEELQKRIDEVAAKLKDMSGKEVCPVCGKVCANDDAFCSACGTKLPEKPCSCGCEHEPAQPDAPADGEAPPEG